MKNKKLFITIIFIFFVLCFTNSSVYASMADYTDEDAEKDTKKMIQEHQENFDSSKSDNNYLKELTVKGGTISPNFERQVIEYSVKIDNNINEIDITAKPEDTRAKIKGTGKIDITNLSKCKIEVVSESGTTRTYFINIVKQNTQNEKEATEEEIKNNVIEDENIIITTNDIKEENVVQYKKENKKTKKYLIGLIIVILILSFIVIIFKKSKKSKH